MKKTRYFFVALIPVIALATAFTFLHIRGAKADNPTCIQTGYNNLTAAIVVTTPGGKITGPVNATGCNIGIYYGPGLTGAIKKADIYGSDYYGVVNNGSKITIDKSKVHDIGDTPFDGLQKGIAIYFANNSGASGSITANTIWNYQKGGIVVNGPSDSAAINSNSVFGFGPVTFIAQNGIQIGYGARATLEENYVADNSYSGDTPYASAGILVVGGTCYSSALTIGTKISGSTVRGNDVGIWLVNLDIDPNNPNNCLPTQTPTRIIVSKNTSTNDRVNNVDGNGNGPYQAGIADIGDYDQMLNNSICGVGYTYNPTPPPYLYAIDDTFTNHPIENGNSTCGYEGVHAPQHVNHHQFVKVSVVR